jgi:hypothetical protein
MEEMADQQFKQMILAYMLLVLDSGRKLEVREEGGLGLGLQQLAGVAQRTC